MSDTEIAISRRPLYAIHGVHIIQLAGATSGLQTIADLFISRFSH